MRSPRPLDELAALLLFWSRDGLGGLRHGADVGARLAHGAIAVTRCAHAAGGAARAPLRPRPLSHKISVV